MFKRHGWLGSFKEIRCIFFTLRCSIKGKIDENQNKQNPLQKENGGRIFATIRLLYTGSLDFDINVPTILAIQVFCLKQCTCFFALLNGGEKKIDEA